MVPYEGFAGTTTPMDAKEPEVMARVSRRRHRRVDAVGRCFVQMGDGWEGSVVNLSAGGLLLRVRRALNPGSSYLLKLFLDDHIAVVEARVVRLDELGDERLAGMEFLGMSAEDASRLRGYVRR